MDTWKYYCKKEMSTLDYLKKIGQKFRPKNVSIRRKDSHELILLFVHFAYVALCFCQETNQEFVFMACNHTPCGQTETLLKVKVGGTYVVFSSLHTLGRCHIVI
jgi:hypothetical protein